MRNVLHRFNHLLRSCHEVGIYDIPATIDFILSQTDHKQLICIASTATNPDFYIMLSELPEYNEKIMTLISFGPYYYDTRPRMPVINTFLNEFLVGILIIMEYSYTYFLKKGFYKNKYSLV